MSRKTREREKFFTEMQFGDAASAASTQQKCEAKLKKCKIGLMIAAVA